MPTYPEGAIGFFPKEEDTYSLNLWSELRHLFGRERKVQPTQPDDVIYPPEAAIKRFEALLDAAEGS